MFGFSFEHLIILVVILLIFGPKRLPDLANNLGRGLKNFKDSMAGVDEAKFRRVSETEAESKSADGTPGSRPKPAAETQTASETTPSKESQG